MAKLLIIIFLSIPFFSKANQIIKPGYGFDDFELIGVTKNELFAKIGSPIKSVSPNAMLKIDNEHSKNPEEE